MAEMENYNRTVIDLLKKTLSDYMATGEVDADSINEAQKRLAIDLDRRKVGNLPCDELEALYGDVMWLKCDLLEL